MLRVEDSDDSHTRRIRRSDCVLPALIGIVGAVEIVAGGYEPRWVALGMYWLAAGVLCARRIAPLVMPPAVATLYALTPLVGFDASGPGAWLLLPPLACFSSGLHGERGRRIAGLVWVLAALAIVVAGLTWFTDFEPNVLFGLIFSVGPWVLGISLRDALARNHRLAAEAEQARLERALAAERAAAAERSRIADELYDALAHALGAMVIQAMVACDLVRRDVDAAGGALQGVAQAGRNALAEMGRLLRLIRDERDELGLQAGRAPVGDEACRVPIAVGVAPLRRSHLLLPALLGVIGAVEMLSVGYEPLWASIGAYWLAAAVLCARHVLPFAMPVAVTGIAAGAERLGVPTNDPASWILPLGVAYLAAGLYVPRAHTRAGLISVLAGIALLFVAPEAAESWEQLVPIAFALACWAIGVRLRATVERGRELAAAAARARFERQLEAERGAAAERRRIARELHDMLANSLSVMIVQATLAADLLRAEPAAAGSAIAEVERAGRTGLRETGRLLQLIEDGASAPGTHPQPGVGDLPALADDYTRAGLAIDLHVDAVVSALPIGVGLSSYRIVQEALTNALKHAPGSRVHIRLACEGAEVAIEVRNERALSAGLGLVPGGHGLVGLRERVSLFGGQLDAGPTPDGGFVLAATLPLDAQPT